MAADTIDAATEWDELPTDGSDAWCGILLCVGSGVVSLKILGWIVASAGRIIMP